MNPTSFVRNIAVDDHAPVVPLCDTLARQYIRVDGWRSTVGVKVVCPFVPSATPVCVTTANMPEIVEAVVLEKSDRSEIWNSYTRVPAVFDDAFCTVKVGRNVASCSSLTGEVTVGAPSVSAGGGGGVVGLLDPLHPASNTAAVTHSDREMGVGKECTFELFG